MKTYTVISLFVEIASGELLLTESQANRRSHALRPLGDGRYEILGPVQFKRGESFGYDLEMPRSLAQCLEEASTEDLQTMELEQLRAFAKTLGLNPHPRMGEVKLREAIQAKQEELLAEQRQARIAELEAKGDQISETEKAELDELKA